MENQENTELQKVFKKVMSNEVFEISFKGFPPNLSRAINAADPRCKIPTVSRIEIASKVFDAMFKEYLRLEENKYKTVVAYQTIETIKQKLHDARLNGYNWVAYDITPVVKENIDHIKLSNNRLRDLTNENIDSILEESIPLCNGNSGSLPDIFKGDNPQSNIEVHFTSYWEQSIWKEVVRSLLRKDYELSICASKDLKSDREDKRKYELMVHIKEGQN